MKQTEDSRLIKINEHDVLRLLKNTKNTKNISDNALNNTIIPFPGFDKVKFDEKYWKTDKKKKYGDSYQLYIQSLRVCGELLNEYENTKIDDYFDKAEEIIYSWIDFSKTEDSEKMIWYDHPTANRTQVIIHYLFLAQSKGKTINNDDFVGVLKKHGEVLGNDAIYKNNNHGLMMDRSLMVIGNILDDELLFNKGYYRAIDTFWFSFSSNGTHLENSPDYHNMVVRMYDDIEKYLHNSCGKSLGENVKGYLKLAKKYPKSLVKPDGRFPAIGDSGNSVKNYSKNYENIYDEEAGIAVMQYEEPKPLYLSFVSGYSSRVHKHKDDLSITLNYNGTDFIVDPGKYNYSKSKERKYIISREAHSSFQMKEFDYSIKVQNRFDRKIKLCGYYENETYTIVKGEHGDSNGSSALLTRQVIMLKKLPVIILLDSVATKVKHNLKFVQNFNLHAKIDVIEEADRYRLVNGEDSFCIKQMEAVDESKIIEGDLNIPVAINTIGFGKAEKTKQIKFDKASNKGNVYCTLLFDDKEVEDVSLTIKGTILEVKIGTEMYYIYI